MSAVRSPQLRVLTNSRAKAFRRCMRLHHLRYDLGVRPAEESENLAFGTLIHCALEAWWWELMPLADRQDRAIAQAMRDGACDPQSETPAVPECGDPLAAALDAIDRHEEDSYVRAKAGEMLRAYHERWINAGLRPLLIEAELYAPLVNPISGKPSQRWMLGGKLDVLARDMETGDEVLIDHKTSSEDLTPGSRFWKRLRMDGQPSQYFELARASGYNPSSFVYDVLRKPQIRPLQATPIEARKYTKPTKAEPFPRLYAGQREADESPDEYGERVRQEIEKQPEAWAVRDVIVRLGFDDGEFQRDIWDMSKVMREAEISGRNPRNPDACDVIGLGLCDYFDLCAGDSHLDDPRWLRDQAPHAELSQIPGAAESASEHE